MSNGSSGTRMMSAPPARPRVGRDPTGVPAHHLDDHHPVVTLGRRLQPVDRVGRDLHRGPEAERVVGRREVVVDRLGHADDVDAVFTEPDADPEGVVAADRDERVDAVAFERRRDLRGAVVRLERVRARRAENGAAAREQPERGRDRERDALALHHAAPAVAVPDERVPVDALALAHHGADHRVEARGSRPRPSTRRSA